MVILVVQTSISIALKKNKNKNKKVTNIGHFNIFVGMDILVLLSRNHVQKPFYKKKKYPKAIKQSIPQDWKTNLPDKDEKKKLDPQIEWKKNHQTKNRQETSNTSN